MSKGILLHRSIDTYTDNHPIFREGTKRLHEKYHHYAGVIMDVFYDHFLAKNWPQYSDEKLEDFVERFYQSLRDHYQLLTEKTQGMMPYMIQHNWLLNYQYKEGIARILFQMTNAPKTIQRCSIPQRTRTILPFVRIRVHAIFPGFVCTRRRKTKQFMKHIASLLLFCCAFHALAATG
jgi:predicted nucleotidyltransferase